MYTKVDLIPVQFAISALSEEHGVPEDLIRSEIRAAIIASRNTQVQEQWSSFESNCTRKTEDEFITWLAKKVVARRPGFNRADTTALE